MALDLRTADDRLTFDRDGDAVHLDGEPADLRHTVLSASDAAETMLIVLDGRPRVVTVEREPASAKAGGASRVWVDGVPIEVEVRTEADQLLERFGLDVGDTAADREIKAPMPGLVLRLLVAPGDAVEAGQGVAVLEAMKMENELTAPAEGTVAAVHVAPGDAVAKNQLLIEVDV